MTVTSIFTLSRSVIGPLTTIATLPEACSGCYSLLGRPTTLSPSYMDFTTLVCLAFSVSNACPTTDVELTPPACLPATTTGYGFFSPGLECPSGWFTQMYQLSYGMHIPEGITSPIFSRIVKALTKDETAAWCCPGGYSIGFFPPSISNAAYCQLGVSTGSFVISTCLAWPSVDESTCAIPATAISDISGSSPITYSTEYGLSLAPAIHIVWRPQDRFTTSSKLVPITTTSAHDQPSATSPTPKQMSPTSTAKITGTSSTSFPSITSPSSLSKSTSLSSSISSSSSMSAHTSLVDQDTSVPDSSAEKEPLSTALSTGATTSTHRLTQDATSSSSDNPPAAPPPSDDGGNSHGLSHTGIQTVTATTVTVGVLGFLGFGLWFGKFRKRRKNSDDDEQNPTAPVDRAVLDGPIKPELPAPGPGDRGGSGADGPNSNLNTGILESPGTEVGGHGQYGDKTGSSQSELEGRAGVSSGLKGGGNISPIAEHPNEQDYLFRDGYGNPHELQSAGVGPGPHATELTSEHRVSELNEQQRRVELEEQQRRFELEEHHQRQRPELMAATPSPAPSYSQGQNQHPYQQPYGYQQHQPYQHPDSAELESPPGWSPRTPQSPSSPQSPRPPVSGPSSGHWSPQAPRSQAQGGDGYYDQRQGQGWGRQSPRQSPYMGSDPRQRPRPPQSPRPGQNQRQGTGPGPSGAGGDY